MFEISKDPFRKQTKEELAVIAAEKKAIDERINRSIQAAKKCFSSTDFAELKESFRQDREGIIQIMKANMDADPLKFAFLAKACLAKIDVFDQIIGDIEAGAKRNV